MTLELGGKSANVVFADADLEKAASEAPAAVFGNAGQDCCARSRILVERKVFDDFLSLMQPAVEGFQVGDPFDEGTDMGPSSPRTTARPSPPTCPRTRPWR